MCALLNGNRWDYSSKVGYNTGFYAQKLDGFKCEPPFDKTTYHFTGVRLCNTEIDCQFTKTIPEKCVHIYIDAVTGKFAHNYAKKDAQSIFGKNVNESDVIFHTVKALKASLRHYIDLINETLKEVEETER